MYSLKLSSKELAKHEDTIHEDTLYNFVNSDLRNL